MLPWMVAYDRVNYTRSLTLYWCEMMALEHTKLTMFNLLSDGEFCVQRSSKTTFSQVPVDQAIEQAMNCHSKVNGGIIYFSQKPGAVQEWVVNNHQRAEITNNILDMAGMDGKDNSVLVHKEAKAARKKADEGAVQVVMKVMSGWINPFSAANDDPMKNISSGLEAPTAVSQDLLRAYDVGEDKLQQFIKDRLLSSVVSFHERIPALKLKTFADTAKSSSLKLRGKPEVVVRADRGFFSRLVVLAQSRSMDLQRVFHYSFGPLPWALATPDGQLAKTSKSTLLDALEKDCQPAESVPRGAAWIVDAMANLQSISSPPPTFPQLAEQVFLVTCKPFADGSRRVDFIADTYPVISIKGAERSQRAAAGGLLGQYHVVRRNVTRSLRAFCLWCKQDLTCPVLPGGMVHQRKCLCSEASQPLPGSYLRRGMRISHQL